MKKNYKKKKLYQFNSNYGWWGTPSFDEHSFNPEYNRTVRIFHDRWGNRTPYMSGAPMIDQIEIVFLGGSHTWGAGIENHETFSAVFGRLSQLPVSNLGHCSFGLDQILLVFMNLVNKTEVYNNLRKVYIEFHPWVVHRVLRKSALGFPKPYFNVVNDQLELRHLSSIEKNRFTRKLVSEYLYFEKNYAEFQSNIHLDKIETEIFSDPIFVLWRQNYYNSMYFLIQKMLELFLQISEESGIEVVFILGPTRQELTEPKVKNLTVNASLPRRILRHKLDALGLQYFDFLSEFQTLTGDQDTGLYSDGHLNTRGHLILAERIAADL